MELVKLNKDRYGHEYGALFTQEELNFIRAYIGKSVCNVSAKNERVFREIASTLQVYTVAQKQDYWFKVFNVTIK